jgi:hypothetical protein
MSVYDRGDAHDTRTSVPRAHELLSLQICCVFFFLFSCRSRLIEQ